MEDMTPAGVRVDEGDVNALYAALREGVNTAGSQPKSRDWMNIAVLQYTAVPGVSKGAMPQPPQISSARAWQAVSGDQAR